MTPSLDQIKAAVSEFQDLVKLAAPIVPGTNAAEKAGKLSQMIDPLVDSFLQEHGTPAPVVSFVNQFIDYLIDSELKAAGVPA